MPYPRISDSSSTERRRRSRKMATMIASPTATSAAATHRTKKTRACPSTEPCCWPKATKARLDALSMISMDMKMTSGLRRTRTPRTPITKRTAESATYQEVGTMLRRPPLGQRNHAHQRREQEHRGDLERVEIVGEKLQADGRHPARHGAGRGRPAEETRAQHHREDDQEQPAHRHGQPALGPEGIGAGLLLAGDEHHDGEHEEDGDGPGIDDDLGGGEELRAHLEKERAQGGEVHDEEEGAVDGVPPEDETDGRAHGEEGEDPEGD